MSLPNCERFGLGLLMPAPVFVALCLLTRCAVTLWTSDAEWRWLEALGQACTVMVAGTFVGTVIVAIPAGLTAVVLEWLGDRGVALGWKLAVGALLGLASGVAVRAHSTALVTPAIALGLAALTGVIVAWTLHALRERPGHEWHPAIRVPSGTPAVTHETGHDAPP